MTGLEPTILSPATVAGLGMAFSPPLMELAARPQALHSPVEGLARAIQLAVTPVFLLAGISGLLGVLTSRLARIVDQVMEIKRRAPEEERLERRRLKLQLQLQRRRMDHASRAIGMATVSFLLVAMVVVVLFLATLIRFDPTPVASGLFVMAMLALMGAVSLLLLEVRLGRRVLEFY